MSYPVILVAVHPCDSPEEGDARVDAAAALARRFGAQLRLAAFALTETPYVATGAFDAGLHLEAAASARAAAEAALERARGRALERAPDAIVEGVTLAALSANAAPAMAGEALYADLTVVGPVRSGVEKALVCGALLETPSAVLVWPGGAAAPPTLGAPGERAERLGRRVAIAWDGRREAARAVRQAAPFLRAAEHVEIVCVSHFMGLEPFDAPAGERLRAHLAAQGVRAALAPRDGGPVGEVLLETAREGLADLIVMGGYGHSRLRESLFGGVTERLIGVSDIPLLLAH